MEGIEIDIRQEKLEEYETKRKQARHIQVSTDDIVVKSQLRQLGEPICLFGEGPADRRDRLREVLATIGQDALKKRKEESKPKKIKSEMEKVTWYHEGAPKLKDTRFWLAQFSIPRAAERLKEALKEKEIPKSQYNNMLQELFKRNRTTSLILSQVADGRPISYCQFSPHSKILATASWSGMFKLWSIPDAKEVKAVRAHSSQICSISFHPKSFIELEEKECHIATSSVDGEVKLWSLESEDPIGSLRGHEPNRVSKCSFHPSGRFMGTTCYDSSWRFWDLDTQEELLHQEGHSKEVCDISFQCDGSLALTGGLDAYGRVWDLRTGRCIMFLEGHLKGLLSVEFAPNGFQMATGSGDNSIKIWDLRERRCLYTIPAHNNLVSKIKFQNDKGLYLVSASYDRTAKIWNYPNWSLSQVLASHEGKIMCADVSNDDNYIVTSTFDKSFKLWVPDL